MAAYVEYSPHVIRWTYDSPAKEHDDRVALSGNETQHEDVLAATRIAFGGRFAKWTLCVQDNFFVLCANKVVDNMGCGGVAPRIAEPLLAHETFDDRGRVVNTTIPVIDQSSIYLLARRATESGSKVAYAQAWGGKSTALSLKSSSAVSRSSSCLCLSWE